MEIKGILKKKFEVENIQTQKGAMPKMSFLILQEGKFPKELFIETLNNGVIQFLEDTNLEKELTIQCEVKSREWNGKYFTSVSAFNVTADVESKSDRKPFVPQPVQEKPKEVYTPSGASMSDDDADGLPF